MDYDLANSLTYSTQAGAFLPLLLSRDSNSALRRSRLMAGNFFSAQLIASLEELQFRQG